MSQPLYIEAQHSLYNEAHHFDNPSSEDDKAAQTRRKNAESQRQYRVRKKEQEMALQTQNNVLKEENQQLRAQLSAMQNSYQTNPWLRPDMGYQLPPPPYPNNPPHAIPASYPPHHVPVESDLLAMLGPDSLQSVSPVDHLFGSTPRLPFGHS
ncbi:hypothetical protein M408DRAFT_325537 [Serendipita vermifera MAFF 305830]|uniref:BZIP domain-containing protein n=1 Tax=Serendipita vermifera MAFF 305830 TaxID=933852 RepID=A0A0C3BRA0_SERVB|nr:hypothetical protein M408DRAFT_325537 [Serendipita vermifera MAFF 305830]